MIQMSPVNRSDMVADQTLARGEVYFLSHGGPPSMFATESEPYKAWERYGKMVQAANPRGLVVVSAHWENESGGSGVRVNTDLKNDLYYDFYNFPAHYYQVTFGSSGSPEMLEDVVSVLESSGTPVERVRRNLDHGVFVPFIVAFGGKTSIPIIQVSLPGDGNPVSSAKLGKALSSLRDQGYAIMGTGQIVHNLRDFMGRRPTPYGKPFMDAVKSALHSSDPLASTIALWKHPLIHAAHPTTEHLQPLAVAVGATRETDTVEEILHSDEGALGWGMYRWK